MYLSQIPSIPKIPYIKGKGYDSRPVVTHGVPREADSILNPKVIGTPVWEEFWSEELYRIVNGYQTGGLWLPGRYYYYMNYVVINDPELGAINPDNTDLHLEIAYLIEHCKKNGCNAMIPKGRRKGVSEAFQSMGVDYDYRFSIDKQQIGVTAGHQDRIDDFIAKRNYTETRLPPELYVGTRKTNDKEIIAGWREKNELGSWVDKGVPSTIYLRTMGKDPNMFKGLYLNTIIVEEAGEFENLLEFWRASKDCLLSGSKQVGSCYIFGTGGHIDKGSKDFKKAWERDANYDFCKANNFIRFVPDGRRFYFYGDASLPQRQLPKESKLFKLYKPYQIIGVEDIELAEEYILRKRKEYQDSGDIEGYNEFVQNNPINEREIFRKTSVNNFNTVAINAQIEHIQALEPVPYTYYMPEYVKDESTGLFKQPREVKMVPVPVNGDKNACVVILDNGHPKGNYVNRYCAGIDAYNIDETRESKSLGAMCVIDRTTLQPVAYIRCRPKNKEVFYELCLKLSIYYKMFNNVLGDIASDNIINHFEVSGCYGYLADRPRKFEALNSKQSHTKWVRLTGYSKPMMIGLMQWHINNHIEKIMFPVLLDEVGDYDETTKDSDNDLADAYGIALIQNASCGQQPVNMDSDEKTDRFNVPKYAPDGNGGMRLVSGDRNEADVMQLLFGVGK